MPTSVEYRARAAELRTQARFTERREIAAELTWLADSYLRLAYQADANSLLDINIELGPKVRLDRDGA